MSMSRWDPWGDMLSLRDAMDQLLRESFVRPATMLSQRSGMGGMPLDVRETDDDYVVRATMPGVKPDDVHIQIKGDTLTISGDMREEHGEHQGQESREQSAQGPASMEQQSSQSSQSSQSGQQGGNWLMRERRYGHFERTITLPTPVNAEKAEASSEHGVLTIRLPKAEESRARSIPVRSGASSRHAIEAQSTTKSDSTSGHQTPQ
ncbi:MAG TPA: Hsp20/alpha crystallin family protein [Thermomicrobiaceae bacterium]|nr:Hsp20/alpha crystallin family protein [Thermomicrobiaceae bacterium]